MGAIGDNYAVLSDLKTYIGIDPADTTKDAMLNVALTGASAAIENHCHRQFNQAPTQSVRFYRPMSWTFVIVDDFWDDPADILFQTGRPGGSFGSPYNAYEFTAEPMNGVANGQPGWPRWRIALNYPGRVIFPYNQVMLTAKWGWPAVPAPVKESCLMLAATNYKMADAPLGGAGFKTPRVSEGGGVVTTVSSNPTAEALLCPYIREEWAV